ncbi:MULTISPECIES: NAD-dependent epimerase/dehydratase family protein [Streptomyces]|uniref:NAD-dependent epimerase/dehydratase family protein n=1 Tax=Streptomyces TaxID=1883 RepID=UPI00025CDE93|nr:NAD-dependent epimerase/dehydratase family protein [Streptomyces tsukubensis]EIF91503.1 short chain dehydrogenase [Streptomyces tsukubensis NRRL18488]
MVKVRIAVTGATGFIGGRLIRHAVRRGDTVTALVRRQSDTTALRRTGVGVREVDWATGDGITDAIADVECVVHLAGATAARNRADYLRGNADTAAVLARCLAALPDPPRLVHCSSLAAAGPSTPGRPRTEADPPTPVSHYGGSKLAGEAAVRAVCERVRVVIVRPPIVYGPGDREFVPRLIPLVRAGLLPKAGTGLRWYSLIHVDDLVRALFAAAVRGETVRNSAPTCGTGVYFVSDGHEYSWQDIAKTAARALGRPTPVVFPVPLAMAQLLACGAEFVARAGGRVSLLNRDKAREMRYHAWTCSPQAAARELNFTAEIPLLRGIEELIGPDADETRRRRGRVPSEPNDMSS